MQLKKILALFLSQIENVMLFSFRRLQQNGWTKMYLAAKSAVGRNGGLTTFNSSRLIAICSS